MVDFKLLNELSAKRKARFFSVFPTASIEDFRCLSSRKLRKIVGPDPWLTNTYKRLKDPKFKWRGKKWSFQ